MPVYFNRIPKVKLEFEKEFVNPPAERVSNRTQSKTPVKKRISPSGNSTNLRIQQLYNRHTKNQLAEHRKAHATKRTSLGKATKQSTQKSRKANDLQKSANTSPISAKKTPKTAKTTERGKKSIITKVQKLSANNNINKLPPQQIQPENAQTGELWQQPSTHHLSSSNIEMFANPISITEMAGDLIQAQPQQQRPPPPPVQIVFTSQVETVGDSSNYQGTDTDTASNLITESTPITWISKPAELNNQHQRAKKMILMPSSVGKNLTTASAINSLSDNNSGTITGSNIQTIKATPHIRKTIATTSVGGGQGNIVQELIVDSNILNGASFMTTSTMPKSSLTSISPNAPKILDNQLLVPARSYANPTTHGHQPTIVAVSQQHQLPSTPQIGATIVTTKNTIGKLTKPIIFAKTVGNTITGANKNLQGLIPIVGAQPIQLKSLQSRGNVKLISTGGKVILKTSGTDDGKGSSPNIRRLLKGVVNQGSFQKMQLLPATNAAGKTNLVFMQRAPISTPGQVTPTSDSTAIKTFINHVTSVGEKIAIYPGTSTKIEGNTMADKLASGNLLSGLLTAGKAATAGITSTIINEDTPVDILPSDGIYDPSAAEPTQSAIIVQSPPPQTATLTGIDTITKQIRSPIKLKSGTTLQTINRGGIPSISAATVTSIVQNYDVRKRKAIAIKTSPLTAVFDNKRARVETFVLDTNVQLKNNAPVTIAAAISPSPGQVINSTDWEKELDQANSMKAAATTSSAVITVAAAPETAGTDTETMSTSSPDATTTTTETTTTKTMTTTAIEETSVDELIEEDQTMIDEMVTESIVEDETQIIECDEGNYITQI